MAKVDIAKEIVENHSVDEVLDWIENEIKNIVLDLSYADVPAEFSNGRGLTRLEKVQSVVTLLNDSRNPKPPVVAG